MSRSNAELAAAWKARVTGLLSTEGAQLVRDTIAALEATEKSPAELSDEEISELWVNMLVRRAQRPESYVIVDIPEKSLETELQELRDALDLKNAQIAGLNEETARVTGILLGVHRKTSFQGREYCIECRKPFWPHEGPQEAAWPCATVTALRSAL